MERIWIDTQIYKTPPQSEGRLDKEMETYALLDKLGIPFLRLDHGEAKTVDDCLDVERLLDINICKNLFLCNSRKTEFYLLMMPGEKRYKASELAAQIQSTRLSFADAVYMAQFLHITPGSVSVLGLMNDRNHDVKLLIDEDLLKEEFIGCHPCVNTTSLKLRMDDLLGKFLPYTGHEPRYVTL
jgi:Ala-tRNA(Pro) deacylase